MKLKLQEIAKINWTPKNEPKDINGGVSDMFVTEIYSYKIELQTFTFNGEIRSVSFTFISPLDGVRDIKTSDFLTANRLLGQILKYKRIQETNA
jgi:hypothetical protein